MPQISVIVPVYNVEKYISRCIDSILAQTFSDFELILVDDGSPDRCGVICDEYAAKDSRIRVIHKENAGPSAARNAGIDWVLKNSNSEWFCYIDSDDWVHLRLLEKLYEAVKKHKVEIAICGFSEETDTCQCFDEHIGGSRLCTAEEFFVDNNINATVVWAKLYHRRCFEQIRYPEGKIHEDDYITYKVLFSQEQIAVIDTPMYAYFINPEGIMRSQWTPKHFDAVEAYKKHILFFKEKGLKQAYIKSVNNYAEFWCNQYNVVNNDLTIEKQKEYLKYFRKRLRRMLLRYRKEIPFVQKNLWKYEIAFPKLMNLYWLSCSVKNKLFKK